MAHPEIEGMDDVWPDGKVDLTLRIREPQSRLERLQQRVLRQAGSSGAGHGESLVFFFEWL